jgi:hypothetical protein
MSSTGFIFLRKLAHLIGMPSCSISAPAACGVASAMIDQLSLPTAGPSDCSSRLLFCEPGAPATRVAILYIRETQMIENLKWIKSTREMSPRSLRSSMHFSAALGCVAMAGLAVVASSKATFAYRPFDGTDAAIAAPKEMEIELQPAGVLPENSLTNLIGPAAIINYSFSKDWELVVQGFGQFPLSNSDENASLAGVGAFLKHILREGSLQEAVGPSIAIEFGPLPGINADNGFGASFGASFRNGGTGELFTRTLRQLLHETNTRTSSQVESSNGRRNGKSAL